MKVVFIHGACVADGAWWWHRVAPLLAERGTTSLTPALPSCGEGGATPGPSGPGLHDDVAAVREALTRDDDDTVVVAHSYGGIVAAEAAAGVESVRHLLLVSSYLPEVGESLSSFAASAEPAPFLAVDAEAGTFTVRPEMLSETFLQDCPPEVTAVAARHLADQSLSVLGQPVRAAAWRQVRSTYLVCTDDRGTPAEAQRRFARRADATVEIDAGHHPFLSRPQDVAELVSGLDTSRP